MTRIEVYIYPKALSKIGIGLGSCLLLLGLFSFTKAISDDFNTAFLSGDWNSVLNIVQGLLFVGLGVYNFRNKKYYIEWDKEELRFVLPDSKKLEKIKFSEIQSVNIKLFEIKLHLSPNRKRTLDINNLRDEDLKKVKSEFKTLQNLNMNINKTGFNILNALLFISITVGFYELVEIKTLVGVFITPAFSVCSR
jgi:hypothetical protein